MESAPRHIRNVSLLFNFFRRRSCFILLTRRLSCTQRIFLLILLAVLGVCYAGFLHLYLLPDHVEESDRIEYFVEQH